MADVGIQTHVPFISPLLLIRLKSLIFAAPCPWDNLVAPPVPVHHYYFRFFFLHPSYQLITFLCRRCWFWRFPCASAPLLEATIRRSSRKTLMRTPLSSSTPQPTDAANDPHEKPGRYKIKHRKQSAFAKMKETWVSQPQKTRYFKTVAIVFAFLCFFYWLSPSGVQVYNDGESFDSQDLCAN